MHPAGKGEFRVFNQFTEVFSVNELAELVREIAARYGLLATIERIENPRTESEEHYYNPVFTKLFDLGLEPHKLSDVLVGSMLSVISRHKDSIDKSAILPNVKWDQKHVNETSHAT